MLDTILSLDPLTLAAVAAVGVGAILAPIVILKKKRKNVYNPLTNPVSTNDAYKTDIDDFSPETYTVGTEDFTGNVGGSIKPKNLSNDYTQESILDDEEIYELDNNQDRMKSAITLDKMGKKAKVAQLLKIMLDKEPDQKEQKRLQVILKYYNKGEMTLEALCTKFPTLIKSSKKVEPPKEEYSFSNFSNNEEPIAPSFNSVNQSSLFDEEPAVQNSPSRQSPPVLTEENVLSKSMVSESPDLHAVEESLKEIAQVAQKQDMQREEDSAEVLNELSALAGLGMSAHKKPERAEKVIYSKEVWANWMSMTNGKMGLKTKFISLENKWPNKAAVEELEQKINTIMGKDANGNQNPWALISVHQLQEGN